MSPTTRDIMLDTARRLFAERGFYGVSLAEIAREQGLTKQALLHHFANKEKLYGEVLSRIADEFDAVIRRAEGETPKARLKAMLMGLYPHTPEERLRLRLLMRELLDNRERAGQVTAWYLKPMLETMVAQIQAIPTRVPPSDVQALATVYQLLGAVNYYAVSGPTLRAIFGEDTYEGLNAQFPSALERLADAALA